MKIALVTGGFDPLHSGHIKYFKAAAKEGDKLYVGINSDDWLANKKGKPFMPYDERESIIKELRFGPNTGDHDFDFKLKHAIKFLQDGAKVKAFVFFRGRTIIFKDKGEILLLKLAQALEEYGVVENMPQLDGKKMIMIIAPKKKK